MPKTASAKPLPALSTAERKSANEGYKRLAADEPFEDLSQKSQRAITKAKKIREENDRWDFYCSIPSKHWQKMSGRQWASIQKQARTYGLPFDGESINLPAVVRALHDFLADNARKLSSESNGDELLAGGSSPALEEYRRERAKLARLDRRERENELLDRDWVQQLVATYSGCLRKAGLLIERRHGPDAANILNDALDEGLRACDSLWPDGTDHD